MALIIGTNQSTAGNLYVLSTGDNFLLPANVVAHSTGASGSGVIATAGGHDLTIDGTLIGSLAGVSMGGIDTDIGNRLTINATGTVAGSTFFCREKLRRPGQYLQ